MPGIIKEVDGKTFVDGGPKCKGKPSGAYIGGGSCADGKIMRGDWNRVPPEQVIEECPACHGAGVQAVQDWTDAEKANWLEKHNPTDGVLTISPTMWGGWGIWYYLDNCPDVGESIICTPDGNETWGAGKDFSAALTAAVIAVARQQTQEVAG